MIKLFVAGLLTAGALLGAALDRPIPEPMPPAPVSTSPADPALGPPNPVPCPACLDGPPASPPEAGQPGT
jgi:hypothetical protein